LLVMRVLSDPCPGKGFKDKMPEMRTLYGPILLVFTGFRGRETDRECWRAWET
ncbi:MAG: hypothetical protein M1830_006779, partial [Pleopsidium flavum]